MYAVGKHSDRPEVKTEVKLANVLFKYILMETVLITNIFYFRFLFSAFRNEKNN